MDLSKIIFYRNWILTGRNSYKIWHSDNFLCCANQPPWNSKTVPGLLLMSHPNGKLSRMSPTAIFSCILLWKNMRKKPPDKYYPPLRYYLALVIVCTVLIYCKQIKAVGNTKGERGTIRPPPPLSVQMDFMWTFEANTKCNNINYVWSHCYEILVVLKYYRRPWANIFDTDICRSINIPKNDKYTTLM